MTRMIKRGEIYYVELGKTIGSEQSGLRPSLIVRNDVGNLHSPTTQIIPLTTQRKKVGQPTQAIISSVRGIDPASTALAEQLRTIDKQRIDAYIGRISSVEQAAIDKAMSTSLGMGVPTPEAGIGILEVAA